MLLLRASVTLPPGTIGLRRRTGLTDKLERASSATLSHLFLLSDYPSSIIFSQITLGSDKLSLSPVL
jgi:hypothetical protein